MPTYRSARDFLSSVAARYRSLQSYSDNGVVLPVGALAPLSCWFETYFVRPQQFRFQFTRPHPYHRLRHVLTRCIVGSDGAAAYFSEQHGSKPVAEAEESLEMAIASATGISQGTAHTVSELLLEWMGGSPPYRAEAPALLPHPQL